jgi:hypothetical protein
MCRSYDALAAMRTQFVRDAVTRARTPQPDYSQRMQPKEVVKAWVATFNRGDADELAGFYAEDVSFTSIGTAKLLFNGDIGISCPF